MLIFTDQPLSTAHVYREFDLQDPGGATAEAFSPRARPRPKSGGGGCRPSATWSRCCENDLEETSCNLLPGLCDAKDIIVQEGALGALMSGSGPTIYGVCGLE